MGQSQTKEVKYYPLGNREPKHQTINLKHDEKDFDPFLFSLKEKLILSNQKTNKNTIPITTTTNDYHSYYRSPKKPI
jgi:hypothetical protein